MSDKQPDDLAHDLLALMQLTPAGEQTFRGESRNIVGRRVFGGQMLGQALAAASRTLDGYEAHTLKADFLAPGGAATAIDYAVDRVSDRRRFAKRRVLARQGELLLADIAISFQVPETGIEHQCTMPDVPGPEQLPDEREATRRFLADEPISDNFRAALLRRQLMDIRPVDPVHPLRPAKQPPANAVWLRAYSRLPDDNWLHQALLAYASDYGVLGVALRPHGLSFVDRGLQAASLDHALWFHRPARFDEWLLLTTDSPAVAGGRGFVRGQMFTRDGVLVASLAQEVLIRQHDSANKR